jgi:hypothetical protein
MDKGTDEQAEREDASLPRGGEAYQEKRYLDEQEGLPSI